MDIREQQLNRMEENAFCFLHLLADYAAGGIPEARVTIPLESHLNTCPRCARELAALRRYARHTGHPDLDDITDDITGDAIDDVINGLPTAPAFMEEWDRASHTTVQPAPVKPGQVRGTTGFPDYLCYKHGLTHKPLPYCLEPRPLLVVDCDTHDGTVHGFPINTEYPQFASNFDLPVGEEETRLGFAFTIETWNPVTTNLEFLDTCWGTLPEALLEKTKKQAQSYREKGEPPETDPHIRRFQQVERQITQCISYPAEEKRYMETLLAQQVSRKLLETVLVCRVLHMRRHKAFLPLAGEEEKAPIYAAEQPLSDPRFTANITVNERETEYLLQVGVRDNETGEETRRFAMDLIQWDGPFPADTEKLKTAYLLLKNDGHNIRHIRLWEKEQRIAIRAGQNILLALYRPDAPEKVECIPVLLTPSDNRDES